MNETGENNNNILEADGLITEIIFSVDTNGKNLKQLTFIKKYQIKNLNITR
ncbi:hypothetical protein [Clostridium tagluense]|uniref:hypothetical protein n=1 Tax=Clostridium tagluense TaxID=360422 RepID=UPI001C0AEAE5|nr:hypothetical protein [Clostridium tagluense]MBU3130426.1 hypothetical protein [Clostridium tagluense]MCB2337429.1 hypothetical protein [Clostridium tagluense]